GTPGRRSSGRSNSPRTRRRRRAASRSPPSDNAGRLSQRELARSTRRITILGRLGLPAPVGDVSQAGLPDRVFVSPFTLPPPFQGVLGQQRRQLLRLLESSAPAEERQRREPGDQKPHPPRAWPLPPRPCSTHSPVSP